MADLRKSLAGVPRLGLMAKRKTPVEPVRDWTLSWEQSAVDLLATGKTVSEIAVPPVETLEGVPSTQGRAAQARDSLGVGAYDGLECQRAVED